MCGRWFVPELQQIGMIFPEMILLRSEDGVEAEPEGEPVVREGQPQLGVLTELFLRS